MSIEFAKVNESFGKKNYMKLFLCVEFAKDNESFVSIIINSFIDSSTSSQKQIPANIV